jgi:hypothetical protein
VSPLARPLAIVPAVVLIACASGGSAGSAASASTASPPREASNAVPREYLVTVAPTTGPALIHDVLGGFGIERIRDLGRDVFLVVFRTDPGLEALEEARAGESRIVAVQPNYVYRMAR